MCTTNEPCLLTRILFLLNSYNSTTKQPTQPRSCASLDQEGLDMKQRQHHQQQQQQQQMQHNQHHNQHQQQQQHHHHEVKRQGSSQDGESIKIPLICITSRDVQGKHF